jgi:protein-S-isoprenylcysteine O-methyltransferase Ste14
MSISIALLIVFHSIGIKEIGGFYQMDLLDNDTVNLLGFVLGLGGLILCWMAQQQMGNSWRVGIDRQNKTDLVTAGVFKKIRNPTYSGIFLICAGSFIIFPTISFMIWVIAFWIAIEFQVRIEEEFLAETHGEQYTRYHQTTKRYIPFFY